MDNLFSIKDQYNISISPDTKIVTKEQLEQYYSAKQLIEQARNCALDIESKAQQDYQKRYTEGYEKGIEEGKEEYAMKMMDMLLSQVDSLAKLETEIAEIVMASVEKVIAQVPDKDLVIGIVRQGIQAVRGQKRVVVRVSELDETFVRDDLKMFLISNDGSSGYIEVVRDMTLSRGDCVIETPMGIVNAGLNSQLEILKKSLMDRVKTQEA